MRIVLHGPLADRFGSVHEIETDIPADAIEGLSRQQPEWPRDLLIDVIDFPTEELLFSETEADEIHLVPRMFGGGGKFGKILVGAALIGVGIATGGVTALGVEFSKGLLISFGAGMVLSGVTQLFMHAPTVSKSDDPPASKYLGVDKSTTAVGTPIVLAWGRINLSAPHWLSLQSNANKLVHASYPENLS